MGLAMLPIRLEGPSAAPLRAKIGQKQIQFVDAPVNAALGPLLTGLVRDEDPGIRKVLRRILKEWRKVDPVAMVAWADTIRGGLARILQDEVNKARRKT